MLPFTHRWYQRMRSCYIKYYVTYEIHNLFKMLKKLFFLMKYSLPNNSTSNVHNWLVIPKWKYSSHSVAFHVIQSLPLLWWSHDALYVRLTSLIVLPLDKIMILCSFYTIRRPAFISTCAIHLKNSWIWKGAGC